MNNQNKFDTFQRTSLHIRWAAIFATLVSFPYDAPQAIYVYGLLAVALLYNALSYTGVFRRISALRSPITIMVVDAIFTGTLVALVGNISTPYSAFFVFMILTAAYLYQMPGVLVVTFTEGAILFAVLSAQLFDRIQLDGIRTLGLTLFALIAFGYQVSRYTQSDREEQLELGRLSAKNERERTRLSTLVDALKVAVFVTDHKGKVLEHNEAARILTGGSDSFDGRELSDVLRLFKRTDPKRKPVDLLDADASSQKRRDLSLMANEDLRVDLDISVTPVQSEGKATEYIIVCEDISRERSLEEARDSFISVASHELRTPLAILEAALESVLQSKAAMPATSKPLIEQAHRSTLQLAGIVKDLAMLAEAENDNIPIQLSQINADEILAECMNDFAAQAEQKGLTLRKEVEGNLPKILSTERHIREILQNFITNALKYTPEGTVTLKVAPAKNGGLLFSVSDQGIGISLGDQKLLFTKFFRAENYLTQTTGGTGLGLYLCMELAKRLGARVWAKSEVDKGSTFFLEVPPESHLKHDQGEVVTTQVANLVDDI